MNGYSKVNTRAFLYCLYFTNTCNIRECLKSGSSKPRLKCLRHFRFPFLKVLFTYSLLKILGLGSFNPVSILECKVGQKDY